MLGDISKTIGKEFLISAVLPSSLLIGTNVLFIRWGLLSRDWVADWDVFGVAKPAAILGAIFGSALILSVASSFIYRIFEGYHTNTLLYGGVGAAAMGAVLYSTTAHRNTSVAFVSIGFAIALVGVGQCLAHMHHRSRAKRWLKSLDTIEESKKAIEQYRFVRRYPQDQRLVRATAFGNILRAFEEYPSRLWSIDPITIWVRLALTLPEAVAAQISDAKIAVTLLLNLCVIAAWLALQTALVAHPIVWDKWFWASMTWMVIAAGAYLAALPASSRWGEHVRSAFDLYRLDLLVKMKIELPKGPFTFADERRVWASLQLATFYAEDPDASLHFVVTPKAHNNFRDPWEG